MSPLDITKPTTSLPGLTLNPPTCAVQILALDLDLTINDFGRLLQAASAVVHAITIGNELLTKQPGLQELETTTDGKTALTLTQLDIVLSDPDLTRSAQGYSASTLPDELVRHCRAICSALRLYWLDYSTVYWLGDTSGTINSEQRGLIMDALRQLSDVVNTDPRFVNVLNDLGVDPRCDPMNNGCLVFDHRRLKQVMDDPTNTLPNLIWGQALSRRVDLGPYLLRQLLTLLD